MLRREDVEVVLGALRRASGLDFRDYRPETVERGVAARLEACGVAEVGHYLARLGKEPEEAARLVRSLIVPMTSFFRDDAAFEALAGHALPALAAALPAGRPLRAWVVGCAAGEEAWSIAMVLAHVCGTERPFELLGTDIEAGGLEVAARGRYPRAALGDLPAAWRHWLVPDGDALVVHPSLRPGVRFGFHDVVGPALAPPEAIVATFELVSFRNVLIYFDRRLQERAIARVAGALEPGGVLLLGEADALRSSLGPWFDPWPGVDPRARVYRRREDP